MNHANNSQIPPHDEEEHDVNISSDYDKIPENSLNDQNSENESKK